MAEFPVTETKELQHVSRDMAGRPKLGEYVLLGHLGAGGMGEVQLAIHQRMDRKVAIKLLPTALLERPDALKRFQREVRVAAQLNHPNIIRAYDAGESDGIPFLVMEYVEGADLRSIIRQHGPPPLEDAIRCTVQAGQGIGHAHQEGVIHRDIKPGNLLLSLDGVVKVLDLGLASCRGLPVDLTQSELSQTGVVMGTIDYLAPEQAVDSKAADPRSDIYSLGCTLYSLVHGRPLHERDSTIEKILAHREADPPDLVSSESDQARQLNAVFVRMVARDPVDRFQSMAEVTSTLLRFLDNPEDLRVHSKFPSQSVIHDATTPTESIRRLLSRQTTFPDHRKLDRSTRIGIRTTAVLIGIATIISIIGYFAIRKGRQQDLGGESIVALANSLAPGDSAGPIENVVSIENGVTVAQDGTGNVRSINEALQKIDGPNQVILVLDDATYSEVININDPARYEGLRLESQRGATIQWIPTSPWAVSVHSVHGVTISGFRITGTGQTAPFSTTLVRVEGDVSGTSLRSLAVESSSPLNGIGIYNNEPRANAEPILIRDCDVQVGGAGILLTGIPGKPVGPARVEDNRVVAAKGIYLEIHVRDVQLTGNVIWNALMAGIELRTLVEDSGEILIANNSIANCASAIRCWDDSPPTHPGLRFAFEPRQIELVNNVMVSSSEDILVVEQPDPAAAPRAVDSRFLFDLWVIEGNWRDPQGHVLPHIAPITDQDHSLSKDQFTSLAPSDSGFLRPRPESPLAIAISDRDDLPSYAGAIPPGSTESWDWGETWRRRHETKAD